MVDDGSTDASHAAMSSIADPRLAIIKQENKGASIARNNAFAASSGSYVMYFDADDIMHPNHLESLLARAEEDPSFIAFSPWVRFKGNSFPDHFEIRPSQRDLSGPDWLGTEWIDGQHMMQSAMFLIPRSFILAHGGWDNRLTLNDDFEFFGRILSRAKMLVYAPHAGLFYRSGVMNSLSARRSPAAILSAVRSITAGVSYLLEQSDSDQSRLACANCLQSVIYQMYPSYPKYRRTLASQIKKLGGSNLRPDGPPGFQTLRPLLGWRAARLIQKTVERLRMARASSGRKQIEEAQ